MKLKFDHINLSVINLEKSINFYSEIFGFKKVEEGMSPWRKKWAILANNDFMLCLTEYADNKSADSDESKSIEHICQIYHFGIRVADRNEWLTKIKAHALRINYGGEITYPFSSSWYISDPSGHEIEVSYTDKEKLQFPPMKEHSP